MLVRPAVWANAGLEKSTDAAAAGNTENSAIIAIAATSVAKFFLLGIFLSPLMG